MEDPLWVLWKISCFLLSESHHWPVSPHDCNKADRCWGTIDGQVSLSLTSRIIHCKAESVRYQYADCFTSSSNDACIKWPQWFLISLLTAVFFPACIHVHRKNNCSKKDHLFHHPPLLSATGLPFKRCRVNVVWERKFTSKAKQKMVFKQATQKALFLGMTFGVGWSYFWNNVWAQNTLPFIIEFS